MGLVRRWADQLKKVVFCLLRAFVDSLVDIGGELRLQNDVVVEVVFQVLGAPAPTMAVIHAKDLELGPVLRRDSRDFLSRLNHV